MANGHGYGRFHFPFVLTLIFTGVVSFASPARGTLGWLAAGGSLAIAALLGWRLAYDTIMWDADEYGGAYTPPDQFQRTRHLYRLFTVPYVVVALAAGLAVLGWRGFQIG